MRVYLDTGVFLDYLIYRSHAGTKLRSKTRRGRTVKRLFQDATSCLHRIQQRHHGLTSVLTLYELEHSVFTELRASTRNITHKQPYLVSSARVAVTQGMTIVHQYGLTLTDLTPSIVQRQLTEINLQTRGIQAADSLHIVTAILFNADILISTDRQILNLSNQFTNQSGINIQCVDTDTALTIL